MCRCECRLIVWLLLALAVSSLAFEVSAARSPNIVLILADDLGYGSLGCYGGDSSVTPHLDRLAAGGVRPTDFHNSGPDCSPTRGVAHGPLSPALRAGAGRGTLTRVPARAAEIRAQRWACGISRSEVRVASVLRDAGCRTGLVGKWHLGYDCAFHPMNYGFDEFRGFMGGSVDYLTHVGGYGLKQLDRWNG